MSETANLVILEQNAIREQALTGKTVWLLGRRVPGRQVDVALSSPLASRTHGEFHLEQGQWFYQDLGSLNGTFLNGDKLPVKTDAYLQNGDILRVDTGDLEAPDENGILILFESRPQESQWQEYDLTGLSTTIGRERACDLVIDRPYVADQQLTISQVGNSFYAAAANSAGGTKINNHYISGQVPLHEKDVITFSNCRLIFTNGRIFYSLPAKQEVFTDNSAAYLANKLRRLQVKITDGLDEKVRFAAEAGALVGLLGPSIAKLELIKALAGQNASAKGEIRCQGVDCLQDPSKATDQLAFISSYSLDESEENMPLGYYLSETAKLVLPEADRRQQAEQTEQILQLLDLESSKEKRLNACSESEKRLALLGKDLLKGKLVLILDEPDAGLSPRDRNFMFTALRKLAHNGNKTVVASISQIQDIDCFDKVVVLKEKAYDEWAAVGTPEIIADRAGIRTSSFDHLLSF